MKGEAENPRIYIWNNVNIGTNIKPRFIHCDVVYSFRLEKSIWFTDFKQVSINLFQQVGWLIIVNSNFTSRSYWIFQISKLTIKNRNQLCKHYFFIKELSFCHKFKFLNPYIFAAQCRTHLKFQTINYVRSNSLSLNYQKFAPSYCKES